MGLRRQLLGGDPPHDEIDADLDEATRAQVSEDSNLYSPRFVAALWTIMQQRIALSEPQHVPRTVARPVAESLAVPPEVILVDIRRATRPKGDGEPRSVEWSHQWLVDGHWRNQYLPSTGGHRQQWIEGYVKGPEDRPLIVKDRVHRVVR